MKVQLKFDYSKICEEFLKLKLTLLNIKYKVNNADEIEILQPLDTNESKHPSNYVVIFS